MIDIITKAHAEGAPALGGDFGLMNILPVVLIFGIIYFFMIRPQNKRAKEHKAMIESLKRGDKVITAGGFIGTVTSVVDQNEVLVELAKDVEVRVVRSSVSQVISKTGSMGSGSSTQDKEGDTQSTVKQLIQKKTGKKVTTKKS